MLKKGQVDDKVLIIIAIILIIIGSVFFGILSKTHSDRLNEEKTVFLESEEGIFDTQLLTLDLLTILDTQVTDNYNFQEIIMTTDYLSNLPEDTVSLSEHEIYNYVTFHETINACNLELFNLLDSALQDAYSNWQIYVYEGEEKLFYCGTGGVTSDTSTRIKVPASEAFKTMEIEFTIQ
tara:strand:- start:1013 stop:1549 length:537 start_codon:yes stop_codon:yes gene_type:complete